MNCIPRPPLASLLFTGISAQLDAAEIAVARRHKVDLLLFAQLLRERPEALTGHHRVEAVAALQAARAENARLLDELLRILARLDAAGIPALPLKGPVLVLLLHNDLSVRRCQDLDLLVPEERVDEAIRVLQTLGYHTPPWVPELNREIHLVHEARELVVDLHWNIVSRKMPFALDFAALWAERRLISWRGAVLPVPPPEWLVVATCLYLVKEHPRPGLLYLLDLQRLLAQFPDCAWGRVAAIATGTGTRRICALGLTLLGEFAGAAIPPQAREHFAASRTVQAAAARLWRALSAEEYEEWGSRPHQVFLHQLWNIVALASFRERPTDKLRVYLSLVPLFLPSSASHWRWRARRGPAIAASLMRDFLRSLLSRSRALFAAAHFRPAPGTSFHPLDDAGVLFTEATQEIYALSPSAAFLWCCLEDGCSFRRTAKLYADASGRSLKETRADVAAMLRTWRARGLLGAIPAAVPQPQAEAAVPVPDGSQLALIPADLPIRQRYKLLGSVFEVGFGSEALCRAVDPALRHLATSERPDSTVAVLAVAGGFGVVIDGRELDRCGSIEALGPMVKGNLNAAAVNRHDFALYLHAAMLRRNGAALLLPAAPGSGKTCLAAALARAGFAYHTDEITLLERGTLEARGAPVALTVKDGSWPVLEPLYPEIRELATHRRLDGKLVRYLPPPVDAGDPALDRSHAVRWIVFPRYRPEGPTRIEPVPRVEALRLLLDECLALRLKLDSREVQALVEWIAGLECHVLVFNNLRVAVQLIEDDLHSRV